jgi:hypothetical protein
MNVQISNEVLDSFQAVMNRARTVGALFPELFNPSTKHNHYADFGYPEHITFEQFYKMFARNGIASAVIKKVASRSWRDNPSILEAGSKDKETTEELLIRTHLNKIRFWQNFADADVRSMVGDYAALILRVADSQAMETEIGTMASIEDLIEVIPAWQSQITVADWDTNKDSLGYGKPNMYQFNESAINSIESKSQGHRREFKVHPSRVIIISSNGTVHNRSLLEPAFNDLIDLEKIKGAGAEGFYKNSKSSPVLSMDKDAKISSLAAAMGVEVGEVADKMQEVVADWNKGFDASLFMQGIDATFPQISLAQPQQFYAMHLQSLAAAAEIPLKILVGMQTGQRASTEDAKEFNQTIMSRRNNTLKPTVFTFINRMVEFGALSKADWIIDWDDLTESSSSEKLSKSKILSGINHELGDEIFSPMEIRVAAGYPAEISGP